MKREFTLYEESGVKNFSLHEFSGESCVNAYSKDCSGCEDIGADIMLTFGSTINVLDGNNETIKTESPKHVDVFLSEKQAKDLILQIIRAIQLNRKK